MSKKFIALMIFCVVAIASFAACSSDSTGSSSDKDKFVGGKWIVRDIKGSGDGYDLVFKEDGTFDGYLPGATYVKILGPYSVEGDELKGDFTATSGGRIGRIEATLEDGGRTLFFRFIETNAFNKSPDGIVILECRGPNPTKP